MDMFLHDLKIKPFQFTSPYPHGERQGLYLEWYDKDQRKQISDVCLLPGYSMESYQDVIDQLNLVKNKAIKSSILYPSLHFALFHPLNLDDSIKPQKYQALIQKNTLRFDLQKTPYFDTLKIKTKNFTADELIHLTKKFSSTHIIRFDANRMELDQVFIDFLIENSSLYDFIEEPLLHQENASLLKVALDETIYLNEEISDFLNIKAIIYKPTLCGGLEKIRKFLGVYPIILSSCFESSIGLKRIIKLHQTISQENDVAIGLDTMPERDPFNLLIKQPPVYKDSTTGKRVFETIYN